jgi:hypothetical protein
MRCARIVRVLALALLPAALAATAALAQPAQAASSSSIVSSATSPAHGQPITFTATVTGGSGCAPAAGDAVVFSIDDVTVATAQLSAAGMASYTTSDLTSGQHTIAAQYTGNTGCAPSSASLSQLVGGAGASLTTLAVGSSTQPTTATTVFTATVSGTASPCIAPSGSVTFRESSGGASQVLGTAPLGAIYAGQALFGEAGLSAGLHTFVAVYPGDANCAPSVSGTASVNVIGPTGGAAGHSSSFRARYHHPHRCWLACNPGAAARLHGGCAQQQPGNARLRDRFPRQSAWRGDGDLAV